MRLVDGGVFITIEKRRENTIEKFTLKPKSKKWDVENEKLRRWNRKNETYNKTINL